MKTKKVLAAVNDEITAIQVNNLVNQPGLWELEFIHLTPELVSEILEWKPDLVIFDMNLTSCLNGTDYIELLTKNNIPFLCITSSEINTALSESVPSQKSYKLPDLKDAIYEALVGDQFLT